MIRRPPRSTLFPLHDALPICVHHDDPPAARRLEPRVRRGRLATVGLEPDQTHPRVKANGGEDRKSTRLNSSHGYISYAVFCLKKKKKAADCDRTLARRRSAHR